MFRLGRMDPNSLVSRLDKYLVDKIVAPLECQAMIANISELESLIDAEQCFLELEYYYADTERLDKRKRIIDKSRENLAEYKERLKGLRVVLGRQHVALTHTHCSDL